MSGGSRSEEDVAASGDGADGDEENTGDAPTDDPALPIRRLLRVASAVFAIVFALVVASAITAPVTGIAVRVGLVSEETSAWQVLRTVVQFGGFFLAVLGYFAFTDEWDLVDVEWLTRRDAGLVAVVAVALLALQYGALYVLGTMGITTGQNTATVPAGDPVAYYLAMIAVSILIVGPVEELLFRGVVQGGLRNAFDATPAVLLASALFALVHLPAIEGTTTEQFAYVGIVFALGCLLGYLYERTGNVLVPGLAHGAYNAAIYAILLAGTVS